MAYDLLHFILLKWTMICNTRMYYSLLQYNENVVQNCMIQNKFNIVYLICLNHELRCTGL